jgi:hypothetical protein
MLNSYITNTWIIHLPNKNSGSPRNRYQQYVKDLYLQYHDLYQVSESTFTEGGQYNYHEISQLLIEKINQEKTITNCDLLTFSYWYGEYDPDIASVGPQLIHQFNLNCDYFDVCDQGTIASLSLLKTINQLQKKNTSNKTVLLGLEQTTVPRDLNLYELVPQTNGGAALWIESFNDNTNSAGFKIEEIQFYKEPKTFLYGFNAHEQITSLIKNFSIAKSDLLVCFAKDSFVYKSYKFFTDSNNSLPKFKELFYDYRHGILPFFECLNKLEVIKLSLPKYILIFLEDAESIEIGLILLSHVSNIEHK